MSYKNKISKRSIHVLIVLFFAFISGCKSPDGENSKAQNDSGSTNTGAPPAGTQVTGFGNFQFLALEAGALNNFFNNATANLRCGKVVFRFYYNDEGKVLSEAFGAKRNDKQFILPGIPLTGDGEGINLGTGLYLSDLELTKQAYTGLGAPGAGQTHLIFLPTIADNYARTVTYKVKWGVLGDIQVALKSTDIKALAATQLNPSPPADPCLAPPCDQ